MKKNKQAASIILAIILTIIMSLIALYMIDYIIPFSRNVKWIENVAKAYYQAEKWVEESLYFVKWNFWIDKTKSFNSTKAVDDSYNIVAIWNLLPPAGQGNSEFDKDFNKIRVWDPIQLKVWKGRLSSSDWNNIKFTFIVPPLDWSLGQDLSWSNNDFVINWQLISSNWVLNANNSQITYKDINDWLSNNIFNWSSSNSLWNKYFNWIKLDWTTKNFKSYYNDNCTGTNSGCILKMSVINKLEVKNWTNSSIPVPYLEWKIDLTWTSKTIPLRYTQIQTEWKSYWFKKTISIRVPQQTVNEAFDFTVFQ